MLNYETKFKLPKTFAGVDEAGRGPLAGPVVAATVILNHAGALEGLNDSKKLSPTLRRKLFQKIRKFAFAWSISVVNVSEIDEINILQATRKAMKQAVENLSFTPNLLLIDGNQKIDSKIEQITLVKGDGRSRCIAAASILAKVTRDKIMEKYHSLYPQYAFNLHKGYGTALHRDLIRKHGPCPIHRKTFKGVKEYF